MKSPNVNIKETIPSAKVQAAIRELADALVERFDFASGQAALVGIQTRGVTLAKRIVEMIRAKRGVEVHVGSLDITLYRDDFGARGIQPIVGETNLDFDIDDKHLVLVDDVLFTGRTVRAALDEIMDFGRPRTITLAALVDRGHRELPIAPDFAPIRLDTKREDTVVLLLSETDGKDEIQICESIG
jgi:pyrimidine operon attenuation protein/uracil phosphoribosyltransferase